MRGQLYAPDYRPRLSGHETFPLRYGWLKKAYDAVTEAGCPGNKRSVFADAGAIAQFGVGKNMVGSMRHWAIAAGVVSEDARNVTVLGRHLFDDSGLDPYMEHPSTAWLVHWQIAGNAANTTWFWAFSHCPTATFERDTLIRALLKFARERDWARAAASTIRNDVLCFVRTYVPRLPSRGANYEDALESPPDGARAHRSDGPSRWVSAPDRPQADAWTGRPRLCGDHVLEPVLDGADALVRGPCA